MTPLHKIADGSTVAHTCVAAMDRSTVGRAVLVDAGMIVAVAGTSVLVAVGDGNTVGVGCMSSAWVGCVRVGCTPHAQAAMTNQQIRKKRCILFYSNPSKSISSSLRFALPASGRGAETA